MKISNEVKIGAMIAAVVGMLAYLTIQTGDFRFVKEGYTVKVLFRNIDGVSLNAPVMLNGLEVGKVEAIDIVEMPDGTLLQLTVWLEKDARLTNGTTAYVKNLGFLGEKYVGLAVTSASSGYLEPGSVIRGKEPADLDTLLLDGQDIAREVKEISSNLNERLTKNKEAIDRIVTNVDSSMASLKSITANLDERLTVNEEKIDETMSRLRSSAINLDQFTYDLKMNPWKLLYRPKDKRQRSIEMLKQERGDR